MEPDRINALTGRAVCPRCGIPTCHSSFSALPDRRLIYGAVRLYQTVTAAFGALAGAGAVVLAVAMLAALVTDGVRRWRAIHGVRAHGERILSIDGAWGSLRVDADHKLGTLALGDTQSRFIFADIAGAEPVSDGDGWALALRLDHTPGRSGISRCPRACMRGAGQRS